MAVRVLVADPVIPWPGAVAADTAQHRGKVFCMSPAWVKSHTQSSKYGFYIRPSLLHRCEVEKT